MATATVADKPKAAEEPSFREAYAAKLARLNELHEAHAPLPRVEVRYENLRYELQLTQRAAGRKIKTVGSALLDCAKTPLTIATALSNKLSGKTTGKTPFTVLDDVSGVLKPGTLSLVLSPPGHGKTSFLRALAQRIPAKALQGSITYNGLTAAQAKASGVHVPQLVSYTDQLDVHLPQLTVRETGEFACANSTADPSLLPAELAAAAKDRVEDSIKLLSLTNCANTVVGDDNLRGVSGGEKKRVTILETLVGNSRVLLMDEISTGLDSSVTFDIVSSLRRWAILTGGVVVIALLQPTPETYALFHDVIMLREGAVVYHGPRTSVSPYLRGLGYACPSEEDNIRRQASSARSGSATAADGAAGSGGASGSSGSDVADWLTEWLTHPATTYYKDLVGDAASSGIMSPTAGVAQLSPSPATALSPVSADGEIAPPMSPPAAAAAAAAAHIPFTTGELVKAWKASPMYAAMMAPSAKSPAPTGFNLTHPWQQAQYGRPYPRSFWTHFMSVLARQVKLTIRNKLFVIFRVASAIILALVLGSVFYKLESGVADGFSKYGLFLFGALQMSFANFSEVPIAVESKYSVYKHVAAGWHPGIAYVLSVTTTHIPIALAESIVFSAILYPMTGLVLDAGRFFFFFMVMFLVDIAMAAFFRIFAYAFPDMESAQVAPGPVISIQMLFAGFLIARQDMGWLLFMNYLSLFAYALKSLALNEFLAPEYMTPVTTPLPGGGSVTIVPGTELLALLDTPESMAWKWAVVPACIVFAVIATSIAGFALSYVRIERNIGTSRSREATAEGDISKAALGQATPGAAAAASQPLRVTSGFIGEGTSSSAAVIPVPPALPPAVPVGDAVAVPVPEPSPLPTTSLPSVPSPGAAAVTSHIAASAASAASALPFTPVSLVFRNIKYTVPIAARTEVNPTTKVKTTIPATTKVLLQNVSGFALPGTVTALMGASGAGKTTLLDVIGGRKNSGKMEGEILINGHPKDQKTFSRITGYVEQMDIAYAYSTVREALDFSASLRLPSEVTADRRAAWVNEVMSILELDDIADRKIGEVGAADGLSPGQRKRLTIGVELVANPPILFLDEPTSGLDSRAAAVVARVIRRIADRGRTVITTIHQPAAEIVFTFDSLLLLQRGGWMVFFGPIGRRARDFVRYFEGIPGVPRCPPAMNPTAWALDQLGGTDSSGIHGEAAAAAAHRGEGGAEDAPASPDTASSAASATAAGNPDAPPSPTGPGGVGVAVTTGSPDRERPQLRIVTTTAHAHGEHDPESGKAPRFMLPIPEGAIDDKRGGPSDTCPGKIDYQAIYFASPHWAARQAELQAAATPAPGSAPIRMTSVYARSFFSQIYFLTQRGARGYWRNVEYNWVRVTTLVYLHLLFGVVYYKIGDKASTLPSIQSMVSVMFMTSAFVGLLNMNTALPVLVKERPVVYRERMSYLYSPTAYGVSAILNELPWMAVICLTSVPVIYFMCGFLNQAGPYFFYTLVNFVFVTVFVSLAQFLSALLPNIAIAQAIVGLIIPILFLLGGLFLREPAIPRGWKWLHYADPIKYALETLVAPQFWCDPSSGTCPTVQAVVGNGIVVTMDRYDYVSDSFGIEYSNRWRDIGILCAFIGGFQILHFICVNFVTHVKR